MSEREGALDADTAVKRPPLEKSTYKAAILKYKQLSSNLSVLSGLEILGMGPN